MVVFDFNGTAIDDLPVAYGAVCAIFQEYGLEPPSLEVFKAEMGTDWMKFYLDHGIPESATPDDLNVIRSRFYKQHGHTAKLRDDFVSTVRELARRGVMVAICSAEQEEILLRYLEEAGLTDLIPEWAVKGAVRDKAQTLLDLAEAAGQDPDEVAYVDDSYSGLTAARTAGVVAVGFDNATGYAPADVIESAVPDFVINEIGDVLKLLQLLNL
jgi:beta-phosphoglucomutase-like phosphatase (HAD superfamily)